MGPRNIIGLVGVYDADGTLRGEVAYWIGARLGQRHCSLCEVTHGTFTEKRDWKRCRDSLPVPFETFHRDDQPDDVRRATEDRAPVVVARTSDGILVLLDDTQITATAGDPFRLVESMEKAADEAGLVWRT